MNKQKLLPVFIVVIGIILFIINLYLLITNAHRGLDVSDESYYLLTARYPNEFSFFAHADSQYLHYLFAMVGYNITAYRILGIIILICTAYFFGNALIKSLQLSKVIPKLDCLIKLGVLFTICSASLVYYRWWLITPSYNWGSFVYILAISGIYLNLLRRKRLYFYEILVLSLVFGMLFLAKITSCILIGLLFVAGVFNQWKHLNKRNILYTAITIITVNIILLFIFFGVPTNWYEVFLFTNDYFKKDGANHGIKYMLTDVVDSLYFIWPYLGIIISTYYIKKNLNKVVRQVLLILLIGIAFLLVYTTDMPLMALTEFSYNIWQNCLGIITILIVLYTMFYKFDKTLLFTIIILILLSFVQVLGTNADYVREFSNTVVFIFILYLILGLNTKKLSNFLVILTIVGINLCVYSVLNKALEKPYRLGESIDKQIVPVKLLQDNNVLYVDVSKAKYVNELQSAFLSTNSESNYLFDLTGSTNGARLILGLKYFLNPWPWGGFPNVKKIASVVDKRKLKNAWLLTTKEGGEKRALTLEQIKLVIPNFPENYTPIKDIIFSVKNYKTEIQTLWKPIELESYE